jgi:hypothetical protein
MNNNKLIRFIKIIISENKETIKTFAMCILVGVGFAAVGVGTMAILSYLISYCFVGNSARFFSQSGDGAAMLAIFFGLTSFVFLCKAIQFKRKMVDRWNKM